MNRAVFLLMLVSGSAFAGLCSDSSLSKAKEIYAQAVQEKSAGLAAQYDVLMAEKNVLDIELCIRADDASALSALAGNVNARLNAVISAQASHLTTADDVSVVKNEKAALELLCSNTLLPSIREQAKLRLASASEEQLIAAACDSLR